MILCRVVGNMVATRREAVFEGKRIMWVQPLGLDLEEAGKAFLTLDAVGSGEGETVLVLKEGSGSMQVFGLKGAPVSSAIVAIVDELEWTDDEGVQHEHTLSGAAA